MTEGVRIAVVAGEVSGDQLGAGLLRELRQRLPGVGFEGVGGPLMIAEGCKSLVPIETLSVLGVTEIAGRLFKLLRIRRALVKHFLANPPDLFIGVDSPGFNLGLAERLKRAGIPTIQYVSPQVWAWRTYRVRKIRRAVDRVLALFPFESQFYKQHSVPATFVGHPLADEIVGDVDRYALRKQLQLPDDKTVIALLPGSRVSELKAHAELFVRTAQWLHARNPQLHFIAPFVNRRTRVLFEDAVKQQGAWDLPITRLHGHSRQAMGAADIVLLASGTAALEAMLLKRLMVVTYKVSLLSSWLIKAFAHVKYFSMPNHLAGRRLVPEYLQHDAWPAVLGQAVEHGLKSTAEAAETLQAFESLAKKLRRGANARAAKAVLAVLRRAGKLKKAARRAA